MALAVCPLPSLTCESVADVWATPQPFATGLAPLFQQRCQLPDTRHLRADTNAVRARSAAVLGGARACSGLAFITIKSAKAVEDAADDDDNILLQVFDGDLRRGDSEHKVRATT